MARSGTTATSGGNGAVAVTSKIEPVRQARDACYALRSFVEADPRWTQGRLRWDHIVVLPNSEVPEHFALPECPRWQVVDRDDLPALAAAGSVTSSSNKRLNAHRSPPPESSNYRSR